MKRTFLAKLVILAGAVLTALLLTVYRPSPEGIMPFGVGQAEVRAAPGTPAARAKTPHDLGALRVVNATLQKVHDNYVDPTRIDSKEMLLAALDRVQRSVAEILVEPAEDKSAVTVQVNEKRQRFEIADVNSPWRLHARMREIFRFIQANMNRDTKAEDVEYAAANGLLSTLDPHSVLISPEEVDDLEYSTTGKFGGIGISIGMRNKKLTVLKLLSNTTPAARAGLKAGDHIVKINGEPTQHLTLNECMSRLRGDPKTKVVVTIERRGEVVGPDKKPQIHTFEATIIRDVITVSPVEEARLLKGGVGYLRLTQFPQSTARDVKQRMEELRAQGAKAWVLDLRGNPGGLLDQAVKVADLFVDSGTIVTTVGFAGKQRKEERAKAAGTDTTSPVAVLVSAHSASASEIVAGALKNLNRAVVIGQTTFGKGSVQLVFDNEDNSKLKLTIGQYLTPGDVSIQSVGITPDIELVPVQIPAQVKSRCDKVLLRGKSYAMREADYEKHLTSKNVRAGEKPSETVKYVYEPPPGVRVTCDDEDAEVGPGEEPADEEDPLAGDRFHEDFQIQFARDFVLAAAATDRKTMLARGRAFVHKRRVEEEQKMAARLAQLGIDWTTGPRKGAPKLIATFTTDRQGDLQAGETVAITGAVKNEGTGPAYQVHAYTKSDDGALEDLEFPFGRIEPGQTKTFTTYVRIPKSSPSRTDHVQFIFSEANGAKVQAPPMRARIQGLPRPLFAYRYQLVDARGNGDGLLQRGESFRLHVTVKNLGPGKSHATEATLKNNAGDGVIVTKGRFLFEDGIAPGETKTMDFEFDVSQELKQKELVMELLVYDTELYESVGDKLKFPVREPAVGPQPATGVVKVTAAGGAVIHEGAAADSAVIGTAKKGATFRVTGRDGEWTRVELEPGRTGFIASSQLAGGSGRPNAEFTPAWQVTPPTITLASTSLETTDERWKIAGTAQDDRHVEDVVVYVTNRDAKILQRKVLYQSNRGGKTEAKLDFAGEIPVWPGNNEITVVARENNDVKSMYTLFVLRASADDAKAAVAGGTKGR